MSFSYPGSETPTLRELSLTIRPGERVGLIGKIGSGKTTIGKLIAGLYAPAEGSVLVGGADNRSVDGAVLRHAVAYVPQEPELFTGSVRDNIVLGRPWASEDEIAEVAKLAGVEAFTAAHPLGLGLPVGERGLRLSGGQRQAVALARMLIRKPSVLFLDEPSSALDTATEAGLVQELASVARQGHDPHRLHPQGTVPETRRPARGDRRRPHRRRRTAGRDPRQDEGRPARQAAGGEEAEQRQETA